MPHFLRGADAGAAGTSSASLSLVLRFRRGVPLRVRGALRGSTDGVPRRPSKPGKNLGQPGPRPPTDVRTAAAVAVRPQGQHGKAGVLDLGRVTGPVDASNEKMGRGQMGQDYIHGQIGVYCRLLKERKLQECIIVLESLRKAGVRDVALRVHQKGFMQACAAEQALPEAFAFAQLVSPPDLRVFNMLLSVCGAACDVDAAFRAFSAINSAGLQPDTQAFTALISCCARACDVERAFGIHLAMSSKRIAANVVTYGALMDCLSRDIERAAAAGDRRRVIQRLEQCSSLSAEMRAAGVRPDAMIFNSLISACGRAAGVQKNALRAAFAAVREMRAQNLQACAYTYAALIDGCTRAGDAQRALGIWTDNVERNENLQWSPQLVAAAVHACAVAGDLPRAMAIYKASRERGVQPDGVLIAALMDAAAKAGQVDLAFELQEEMKLQNVPPNAAVSSTLVGICARGGETERARSIFRAMHVDEVRPSASAVNALVAAHARAGDLEGAFDALAELSAAGLAPTGTTYATLISACGRRGDLERATNVFERMRAQMVQPPPGAYRALISSCCTRGALELALQWLGSMHAAGASLDAATARALLGAAARTGHANAAWAAWRAWTETPGLPITESALSTLLSCALVRLRELDGTAGAEGPDGVTRAERAEWERRAVSAYVYATATGAEGGGIVPRVGTFSAMLACLRQPQPKNVQSIQAAAAQHLSPATSAALAEAHFSSAAMGAMSLFPERALMLYEEAQAGGIVPRFPFAGEGVMEVDLRELPPAAAEVCVLTLLRVLRRLKVASGDSRRMRSMWLRVPTAAELQAMASASSREAGGKPAKADAAPQRKSQTGARCGQLLRRLKLKFSGSAAEGGFQLSHDDVSDWLASSVVVRRAPPLPGTAPRLPLEIREQRRRILSKDW